MLLLPPRLLLLLLLQKSRGTCALIGGLQGMRHTAAAKTFSGQGYIGWSWPVME